MKAPVVFFDGVCGLCNRFVDFLLVADKKGRLRFAPLQGETALRHLGPMAAHVDSIAFWDNGQVYRDVEAVARIFACLGWAWRLCGHLISWSPRPVARAVYFMVARRRYTWFGRRATCRLPTPAERLRFLP